MRRIGLIILLSVLVFPALEIYTMFVVAHVIGWWLLAWLILSALIGWLLIKEESMAVFGRFLVTTQSGQSPFAAIWDSGRTMLAGLLLIIPGVLSDIIALILLILPNKTGNFTPRSANDENVFEGEVRVVDAEKIESKHKPQ